jgi:hypothetical protein
MQIAPRHGKGPFDHLASHSRYRPVIFTKGENASQMCHKPQFASDAGMGQVWGTE